MSVLSNILGLLVSSALMENAFYARAFSIELADDDLHLRRDALPRTVVPALMCLPAAFCGWLGRLIFTGYADAAVYFGVPVSVLLYALFFMGGIFVARRLMKDRKAAERLTLRMPYLSFAFLPVGVLLLTCLGTYNWYESLAFGFGSGLGHLIATRLHIVFANRLKYSKFPFFLRGLPIRLIGMGLISLALFGLLGHSIAV